MVHHPPFNGTAKRFNKHDAPTSEGPDYHAAYRDLMQPERRSTKGWTAMDDSTKGRRGTGAGKVFSSMAARTAPPAPGSQLQPVYTSYPNETRLQELLDLQKRRLAQGPGPGQYEVPGWQPSKTCFRRQALPQLDGPFLPPADSQAVLVSTRQKEMEAVLRNPYDSGLSPGDYNSHESKDAIMKRGAGSKIGTGDRDLKKPHTKSLSVSRSIQHGIDWHVPVVVHIKQADAAAGATEQRPAAQSPARQAVSPRTEHHPLGDAADVSHHGHPEPMLPPPVGGKTPAPPPAVARTIRRPQQGAPSDWDWQQLGHNYRNNWTTLHGGAYSQGDRTTSRRDAKQPDAVDYMGHHTESIELGALQAAGEALGDMFPIPEENSEGMFDDITGRMGAAGQQGSRGSDGRYDSMAIPSTASSVTPQPGAMPRSPQGLNGIRRGPEAGGMQAAPTFGNLEPDGGFAMPPVGLLSQAEIQRREAALQAALLAQQAAVRRAAWTAKAGMVA